MLLPTEKGSEYEKSVRMCDRSCYLSVSLSGSTTFWRARQTGGGSEGHLHTNQTQKESTPQGSEDSYNDHFCSKVGGRREVRHSYRYPGGTSYVSIDCETSDTVYEGGLDKRSSLDSVQQALFFSHLTGKRPAVVIYDRDGKMGRYEYRIKVACEKAGVMFVRFRK